MLEIEWVSSSPFHHFKTVEHEQKNIIYLKGDFSAQPFNCFLARPIRLVRNFSKYLAMIISSVESEET